MMGPLVPKMQAAELLQVGQVLHLHHELRVPSPFAGAHVVRLDGGGRVERCSKVRMLWRRSANFTRMTRASSAVERSIFL